MQKKGGKVFAFVSAGADKASNRGGGALEVGDHRLLEHGSERKGALVSDVVDSETASEGWDGDGERLGVSMGADTWEFRALGGLLEHLQHQVALEALQESSCSFGTEVVPRKTASTGEWR